MSYSGRAEKITYAGCVKLDECYREILTQGIRLIGNKFSCTYLYVLCTYVPFHIERRSQTVLLPEVLDGLVSTSKWPMDEGNM